MINKKELKKPCKSCKLERKELGVRFCPIHYNAHMSAPFKITAVTRADIESLDLDGVNAENLTDAQMEWLARKMADAYIPEMFWESITQIVPLIKK